MAPDPAWPILIGTLGTGPLGLSLPGTFRAPWAPRASPNLRSEGPHPQVLELVSSDSLNVPSEEDVYRAVLSWVKHDVDARRQHVPRVRPGPGGGGTGPTVLRRGRNGWGPSCGWALMCPQTPQG